MKSLVILLLLLSSCAQTAPPLYTPRMPPPTPVAPAPQPLAATAETMASCTAPPVAGCAVCTIHCPVGRARRPVCQAGTSAVPQRHGPTVSAAPSSRPVAVTRPGRTPLELGGADRRAIKRLPAPLARSRLGPRAWRSHRRDPAPWKRKVAVSLHAAPPAEPAPARPPARQQPLEQVAAEAASLSTKGPAPRRPSKPPTACRRLRGLNRSRSPPRAARFRGLGQRPSEPRSGVALGESRSPWCSVLGELFGAAGAHRPPLRKPAVRALVARSRESCGVVCGWLGLPEDLGSCFVSRRC